MSFVIGQNDSAPRLIATLSADYDNNYPEEERIIYNDGDLISLYIRGINNTWNARAATVDEVIGGGKSVRVSVALDVEDVRRPGIYPIYFRNETIKLSFPSIGNATIRVTPRGHD